MANLPSVENFEPFQDLGRDLLCLRASLDGIVFEILAEIAVRDVLHRDIDGRQVLVPAQKDNEKINTLFSSAAGRIPTIVHTSWRSINASTSCVLRSLLAIAFTARRLPDVFSFCSQTSPNAPAPSLRSRTHVVKTSIRRWRRLELDWMVRCVTVFSANSVFSL